MTFCVSLTYSSHCTRIEVLSRVNTHAGQNHELHLSDHGCITFVMTTHLQTHSQPLSPLRSLLIFPLSPLSLSFLINSELDAYTGHTQILAMTLSISYFNLLSEKKLCHATIIVVS